MHTVIQTVNRMRVRKGSGPIDGPCRLLLRLYRILGAGLGYRLGRERDYHGNMLPGSHERITSMTTRTCVANWILRANVKLCRSPVAIGLRVCPEKEVEVG